MKRRELFKFLAATPAAFLVAKYPLPCIQPQPIALDYVTVTVTRSRVTLARAMFDNPLFFTAGQTVIKGEHVSLNADGTLSPVMKALPPARIYQYENR